MNTEDIVQTVDNGCPGVLLLQAPRRVAIAAQQNHPSVLSSRVNLEMANHHRWRHARIIKVGDEHINIQRYGPFGRADIGINRDVMASSFDLQPGSQHLANFW